MAGERQQQEIGLMVDEKALVPVEGKRGKGLCVEIFTHEHKGSVIVTPASAEGRGGDLDGE